VLLLIVAIACIDSALSPDAGSAGVGEDAGVDCGARVVDRSLIDGAEDVWLQPELAVTLDPPDASADLRVVDATGTELRGVPAVTGEGASWRLELDAPLTAGAAYSFIVDHCGGSEQIDFTTVDDPGAPASLSVPRTYSVQPADGRAAEPAGVDRALAPLLPTWPWLLSLVEEGGAEGGEGLALRVAAGAGQVQDTCIPTEELPTASLVDGVHFELGPATVRLELEVGTLTLYELELTGTFAHDGDEVAGVTLSAVLDARDIASLSLMGDTPEDVCTAFARQDVACEDCGDGVEQCVRARFDSWTWGYDAATDVEEILFPDCHPDCADSYTNPVCDTLDW